ncbi:MAG: hypothetical protein HYX67_10855 [Candidatus Melainabacteria bacterium]|nr:hypothetical protein [Candidatus Melainabacteria bacterium]
MSTEQSQASSTGANAWWLGGSAFLFLALFVRAVFNFSWPINHDCAMYVDAGRLVLQGKIPYVDFIDLNPPLIFYISAIPALMGQLTGVDLDKCFSFFIWLLGLLSWLLVYGMARGFKGADSKFIGPILFGLAAFNFCVGEWGEFGQRQHLVTMAIVPFVILRWLRSQDAVVCPWLSMLVGLFLGLGLDLVPQYVLVPLAFECCLHGKKPNLRKFLSPEIFATLFCGIAYGVMFLLLPKPALDAFTGRWMPLTVQGYAAYNASWDAFTTFPFLIGCLPLFFSALFMTYKNKCSLSLPLFVFCAAAYIAAVIQFKGWFNHYLPLFAGSILFVCVQVESRSSGLKRPNSALFKLVTATALLVICAAPSIIIRETIDYPKGELTTLQRETQPGDAVMILSTAVPDIYPPLLLAKCVNGSRYLFYFPIEMLRYQEKHAKTAEARTLAVQKQSEIIAEIEQDISKSKPKLILIPVGKTPIERDNSMVKYFAQTGLLNRLSTDYTESGETEGRKALFAVWKRR